MAESNENRGLFDVKSALIRGLAGVFIGFFGTVGFISYCSPDATSLRTFERANKPAVIRLYRPGSDGIYVEGKSNTGKYIPLDTYLGTIPQEVNRRLERLDIEELVGWYD